MVKGSAFEMPKYLSNWLCYDAMDVSAARTAPARGYYGVGIVVGTPKRKSRCDNRVVGPSPGAIGEDLRVGGDFKRGRLLSSFC